MPVECTVCQRSDRDKIDDALARGEGRNVTAARFRIAPSTLSRHAKHVQRPEPEEKPRMETASMEPQTDDRTTAQLELLHAKNHELTTAVARQRAELSTLWRLCETLEARVQALGAAREADEPLRALGRQFVHLAQTDAEAEESLKGWLWQISGNKPRQVLLRLCIKAFQWKNPENMWLRPQ